MKIITFSLLVALNLISNKVNAASKATIVLSGDVDDCIVLESLFDCTDCIDADSWESYHPYDTTPYDYYYQDYEVVTCAYPG